jgi:nitrous oxidase accessory protein NosD
VGVSVWRGTACTSHAPCSLDYAVANAPAGGTVKAKGGTYAGGIVVATPIKLDGEDHAKLDASTSASGVGIQITASGTSVDHFTVENAKFEGILVGTSPGDGSVTSGTPVDNMRIDHSVVMNDDQGFNGNVGQGD